MCYENRTILFAFNNKIVAGLIANSLLIAVAYERDAMHWHNGLIGLPALQPCS